MIKNNCHKKNWKSFEYSFQKSSRENSPNKENKVNCSKQIFGKKSSAKNMKSIEILVKDQIALQKQNS